MHKNPEDVLSVLKDIAPLLHGREPEIQGAVLAGLMAKYLAGLFIADDPTGKKTAALRARLLKRLVSQIRALIPIAEADVLKNLKRNSH